jgi:hypothetical protein
MRGSQSVSKFYFIDLRIIVFPVAFLSVKKWLSFPWKLSGNFSGLSSGQRPTTVSARLELNFNSPDKVSKSLPPKNIHLRIHLFIVLKYYQHQCTFSSKQQHCNVGRVKVLQPWIRTGVVPFWRRTRWPLCRASKPSGFYKMFPGRGDWNPAQGHYVARMNVARPNVAILNVARPNVAPG